MSEFKPISLIYPIASMAGALLLCAYILHGGDFFAPAAQADEEIASVEDAG